MRLIDADALIEQVTNCNCKNCNHYNYVRCKACPIDDAVTYIDEAPTVALTADALKLLKHDQETIESLQHTINELNKAITK